MLQYSGKENEKLEETIDRNIQGLIDLIRTKYLSTESQNKSMDFGRKAQYFTLDSMSDLAYREPFGFMATDSDMYDYLKVVESVFVAAAMVTIFPWINSLLNLRIMKAILPSDKDPLGLGKIIGYCPSPFSESSLLTLSQHHQKSRRSTIWSRQKS